MSRTRAIAVFSCVGLFLAPTVVNSGEALRMQVSPVVSRAPAVLTIRVHVEPSTDNRSLQIIADSPTFYRSSEVEIHGTESTSLQIFEFRNLPAGLYQVTSVLMGTQGPRGKAQGLAKVEPAVGSR